MDRRVEAAARYGRAAVIFMEAGTATRHRALASLEKALARQVAQARARLRPTARNADPRAAVAAQR